MPEAYLRELEQRLLEKGQLVFYGPPGTGKTFVAQKLALALCEGDESRISLVQFHPSTSYEDFFEGIRPVTDREGRISYEVRPGPLVRMADRAAKEPGKRFVLIIDELNRANLPRVLGELLYLFEYRDAGISTLYRPDQPFRLPKNLWFIGTMNTVDRSVAIIDAAMRRRFHFAPFYPDQPPFSDVLARACRGDDAWVADLARQINRELVEALGSRDHQLGASYFLGAKRTVEGMQKLWEFTIEPLLEDQAYGQNERIEKFRWSAVRQRLSATFPDASSIPTKTASGSTETS